MLFVGSYKIVYFLRVIKTVLQKIASSSRINLTFCYSQYSYQFGEKLPLFNLFEVPKYLKSCNHTDSRYFNISCPIVCKDNSGQFPRQILR